MCHPRNPTPEELTQLAQIQHNYFNYPLDEVTELVDRYADIAVFDDYITVAPHYAGKSCWWSGELDQVSMKPILGTNMVRLDIKTTKVRRRDSTVSVANLTYNTPIGTYTYHLNY